MSDKIITAQLESALAKAFPLPEYALFFEVGDATGGRHSRWADAVAMACWPSRGLTVTGFELKASRSDWLREKKDPTKSSAIQKYCDRWVLVTAPGVLLDGELPETWGHMELSGARLVTKVKAPALTPEALDRPFLAALLRRAGQASEAMVQARALEASEAARKREEERATREIERYTTHRGEAVAAIEAFKEATGVDLLHWSGREAGRDFKAYMDLRHSQRYLGIGHAITSLDKAAELARAAQAAFAEAGVAHDDKAA